MRKILVMAISVALVATLAISGTVAYLMNEDSTVNVMTSGSVFIEQHEQQRVKNADGTSVTKDGKIELENYDNFRQIVPAVYENQRKENVTVGKYTIAMRDESVRNYVDKIVTATNTGTSDAYVRTIIAIPEALVADENEESGFKGFDTDPGSNASQQWLHWNNLAESEVDKDADGNLIYSGWYWGKSKDKGGRPDDKDDWYFVNNVTIKVDGKEGVYDLYVATNKNVLKPGETTAPSLVGFYIDKDVGNKKDKDGNVCYTYGETNLGDITKLNILVATQAVQADGFDDAWTALGSTFKEITKDNHPWKDGANLTVADNAADLQTALKSGKDAVLTKDITTASSEETGLTVGSTSSPTSVKAGYIQTGGVFDGGNHTLTVTNENGSTPIGNWGIVTSGGRIKNVTIEGAYRGVAVDKATEDVIIDNLTYATNMGYALSVTKNKSDVDGLKLKVSNSKLGTYVQINTFESASFTDTSFGVDDTGFYVIPVINTTFTNCIFTSDTSGRHALDLGSLGAECKVTFVNCYVDDTLLTAENIESVTNLTLPRSSDRTLNDCVIFNNSNG